MQIKPNFYKDKFCLNVLAKDVDNAQAIYQACESNVVVGVLSKNYPTVAKAIEAMNEFAQATENAVSVGLGAGDPKQCYMVNEILRSYTPQHVNQVFSAVNGSRSILNNTQTFINSLVSPTGTPGLVKISTGPLSSEAKAGEIDVETAVLMIKEMGGSSIKFFPMGGLETIDEFKVVCAACAKHNLAIEPTGGIDKENFREICQIAYDSGVDKIIPHVYSSIIDQGGQTIIDDVNYLYAIIKEIVK
ncbi:MAG: 2-dehydro-3-deoxy-phosphogluconate aldolase [Mycoplasmatales bacterium]